ncbi:MAG: hypothetical protein ACR2OA_02015 [Rubripirellula sp.]
MRKKTIVLPRNLIIVNQSFASLPFASLLTTVLLMLVLEASSVTANDQIFCVTTKIFVGDESEPVSEHQILFDEGLVYDVPVINRRFITVFDPAQKRVTLLDRDTQVQTSVSTDDLIKITAQARAAVVDDEQKKKLGMDAEVKKIDQGTAYAIKFANLEYRTTTQRPESSKIASEYAIFVDLASRLNLVRQLGPPPFGRMSLHQKIAANGELPLELTLTIKGSKQSEQYRSTHSVGGVADPERQAINEVRGFLTLYRQVELKAFPK